MKNFKYYDNSNKGQHILIFECSADNILEADKKFQDALGKSPISNPLIGCQIN